MLRVLPPRSQQISLPTQQGRDSLPHADNIGLKELNHLFIVTQAECDMMPELEGSKDIVFRLPLPNHPLIPRKITKLVRDKDETRPQFPDPQSRSVFTLLFSFHTCSIFFFVICYEQHALALKAGQAPLRTTCKNRKMTEPFQFVLCTDTERGKSIGRREKRTCVNMQEFITWPSVP